MHSEKAPANSCMSLSMHQLRVKPHPDGRRAKGDASTGRGATMQSRIRALDPERSAGCSRARPCARSTRDQSPNVSLGGTPPHMTSQPSTGHREASRTIKLRSAWQALQFHDRPSKDKMVVYRVGLFKHTIRSSLCGRSTILGAGATHTDIVSLSCRILSWRRLVRLYVVRVIT